jgi:DNA-binding SARP family transcriptional activator/Tfp pilus assembly protein PilF
VSKATSKVEFYVLGTPKIRVGGASQPVPYSKVTALLAYLAVTSRSHSRAALAMLLWGDVDDRRANSSLRNVLYILRRELNLDSCLIVGRHEIGLDTTQLWLDVDCLRHAVRGEVESIPVLREALALWRGPFLDGLLVSGAPDFDDWVSATRAKLERIYLQGCLALSKAHARAKQWPEALEAAQKAVDLDPLYEAGHRQIMHINLLAGSRAAALQQYERCRDSLRSELGVLPSARTQALHKQVLADERLPARPAAPRGGGQTMGVFVGRRQEMLALDGHLEAVRDEAAGRLILVEGEVGVGKTRLLNEWLATLDDAHVLHSRCFEAEQSIPYQPWNDLLRSSMDRARWQQLGLPDVWLAELAQLLPELHAVFPALPPPASPDPQLARGRLGEAIHQWLRILGQQCPICLFLDDLQWMDRASLAVLGYLLRHSAGLPLMILGAQRGRETDPAWNRTQNLLLREGLCHTMTLFRLPFSDVATIAGHAGFRAADSEAFLKRLFRETEGNPLFVVEVLQTLQGLEIDPSGDWPIPPTIKGVIQERLDRLSTSTRQMLTVAAVIGRSFEHTTLHAVTEQPVGQVLTALDEGIEAGLIVEHEGRHDFDHDQTRAVLYGRVSQTRRRHLHYRVARALEASHQDELASYFGLLANHFEAAGEAEKARLYAFREAKRAVELYADEDALAWYDRGLALSEIASLEMPPDILPQVIPFQQRTVSIVRPVDAVGIVYREQGLVHQRCGRYDVARQLFERALARATERGRRDEQSAAHGLLSFLGYLQGDYEALAQHAQQALDLATEAGEDALRAEGLRNMGIAAYRRGEYEQAIELYQESLAASRTIDNQADMAKCYNNIGFALRTLHCFDEAVASFQQALHLHEITGSIEGRAGVLANIGSVYARSGELEQALACLQRAIALSGESHAHWITAKAYRTLGSVHLQAGRWDDALTSAERARDLAEELGSKEDLGAAYRLLGEIAALHPESGLEDADFYLKKGLALLEEVGETYELGRAASSLAAYHQTCGQDSAQRGGAQGRKTGLRF